MRSIRNRSDFDHRPDHRVRRRAEHGVDRRADRRDGRQLGHRANLRYSLRANRWRDGSDGRDCIPRGSKFRPVRRPGSCATASYRCCGDTKLSWKWNQFWKMTIPGSITGLIGGLLTGLNDAVLNGLNAGIYAGLNYGIAVGLIIMLCGGFTYRVKAEKASANQGIKLSLKNSLVVLLVTSLTVGLIIDLIGSLFRGQIGGVWGLASLQATRRTDCRAVRRADRRAKSRGSAAIKHYILRLTLWLRGYTPFHFARFLDQCARLILIKKVGGGYIFTHRMLLEYFAEMTPQSPNLRQSPYVNRTKEISDRGTLTAKPMVPKWKMWLFVCVVLALFVTLCQWGIKLFSERILHTVTSLATLQPFDERLSLS